METQKEKPTTQGKDNRPEYRLSLVREIPTGDQWAEIGVGWSHKDGDGITFTGPLLEMFGYKLIARTIKSKN